MLRNSFKFGTRAFHSSKQANRVAFSFDIDGVLIRGNKVIPEAPRALRLLNEKKVPWILLTNGGGKSEVDRVAELSDKLGVEIRVDQFVQSHTPFKGLKNQFKNVLVVGGDADRCRKVAEDVYGFENAMIPADVVKSDPSVWPFHRLSTTELSTLARDYDLKTQKIDAVLVFNDPRDMGTDIQVVIDILLSQNGYFGTRRNLHDKSITSPSVPIFFSNDDLLWANSYSLPRFGQGAFRHMVEALYYQTTGGLELERTIIGKPHKLTYEYADKVLRDWVKDSSDPVDEVFMVGDNPASDILGANRFGWKSLLVRTGVFKDDDLIDIVSKPTKILNNVEEAVEFGLNYKK